METTRGYVKYHRKKVGDDIFNPKNKEKPRENMEPLKNSTQSKNWSQNIQPQKPEKDVAKQQIEKIDLK